MTFPLVLGSGRRLFNDGILPATMRPVGLTVTNLGIVIGTYQPAGGSLRLYVTGSCVASRPRGCSR